MEQGEISFDTVNIKNLNQQKNTKDIKKYEKNKLLVFSSTETKIT